jgi:ATP-dependent Lhr-like helicase
MATALQRRNCRVTTPESRLVLSWPEWRQHFALRFVVVDEWHRLLGTKRGCRPSWARPDCAHWCRTRVWGL